MISVYSQERNSFLKFPAHPETILKPLFSIQGTPNNKNKKKPAQKRAGFNIMCYDESHKTTPWRPLDSPPPLRKSSCDNQFPKTYRKALKKQINN
ncbi:MAG: hypothetical protein A2W91_12930 [Bacteroidetes bacterium GWF2_38_335]|nr:MAG: hypothetical protein A2W91_12930 [Bacteroidetes bacterium GWF2_38_335]